MVKHEFETLVIAAALHGSSQVFTVGEVKQLQKWKNTAHGVEEINSSAQTAPSKRLKALKTKAKVPYRKVADSAAVFTTVRFEDVMAECPHFADWITRLLAYA